MDSITIESDRLNLETHANPWKHGFRMVDRASHIVVGGCAFKGPPDYHGAVEIAYGVEPEFRQRGYATEAAQALVDFAFAHNVRLVRAHTLANNDASIGVLLNCGFCLIGEVIDPEDGPVLRWELGNPLLL